MTPLDRLERLERETTEKGMKAVVRESSWDDWNEAEISLTVLSRNHLRALIECVEAARQARRFLANLISEYEEDIEPTVEEAYVLSADSVLAGGLRSLLAEEKP